MSHQNDAPNTSNNQSTSNTGLQLPSDDILRKMFDQYFEKRLIEMKQQPPEKKNVSRVTEKQFTTLVEFMERHSKIRRLPGIEGRMENDKMWLELTEVLNSIKGGCNKKPEEWKKFWGSKRRQAKRKYEENNQYISGLEERIIQISGTNDFGVYEDGLNFSTMQSEEIIVEPQINVNDIPTGQGAPSDLGQTSSVQQPSYLLQQPSNPTQQSSYHPQSASHLFQQSSNPLQQTVRPPQQAECPPQQPPFPPQRPPSPRQQPPSPRQEASYPIPQQLTNPTRESVTQRQPPKCPPQQSTHPLQQLEGSPQELAGPPQELAVPAQVLARPPQGSADPLPIYSPQQLEGTPQRPLFPQQKTIPVQQQSVAETVQLPPSPTPSCDSIPPSPPTTTARAAAIPTSSMVRRRFQRKIRIPMLRTSGDHYSYKIEHARLRFENLREMNRRECERQRIDLDSRRIKADQQLTQALNRLADNTQKFIEKFG